MNATRGTVSTFGVLAGLAGIEHGIGEVLQGNRAPEGVVILSWPGSEAFRILAGEPALTLVPNLLATGLLAIAVSVLFLVWVTVFVQRRHAGMVFILLSVTMLSVGAGFGRECSSATGETAIGARMSPARLCTRRQETST